MTPRRELTTRDPRTTAAPLPSGAAVGSEPSLAELGMRFWEDLLLRTRAT